MPDDENDKTLTSIEESVQSGIKRAQGDQGSVEEHPLPDRIAADKYLKNRAAARRGLGMRLTKLVPPGTT
jgi:hypothetical protein